MRDEKEKVEVEEELACEYGSALFQKRHRKNAVIELLIVLGIPLLIVLGLHFGLQTSWWINILIYIVGFITIIVIISSVEDRLVSQIQLAKVRLDLTKVSSNSPDFISYETAIVTMYKKKILFKDARQLLKDFGVQIAFDELIEELKDLEKMDKVMFKKKMQNLRVEAIQYSSKVNSPKAQAGYFEESKKLTDEVAPEVLHEENETTKSRAAVDNQSEPPDESSESTASDLFIIDINTATEVEIAKLPKLNIILAKKIIQVRERLGGFETFEQFVLEVDLNEVLASAIEEHVTFSEVEEKS